MRIVFRSTTQGLRYGQQILGMYKVKVLGMRVTFTTGSEKSASLPGKMGGAKGFVKKETKST